MKYLELTRKPKVIYTDNSVEFGKSCEELSWNHWYVNATQTNGIAERAVRSVKEGTSAVLLQSSLGDEWWADSMECFCYLRNLQDLLSVGKTPYERRFGMPFDGPVIPFGAMVELSHCFCERLVATASIRSKSLARYISRSCILYARRIWKGDILAADVEELEEMDASELYTRMLNAKEVLTPQRNGNFIFPVADGTVKILEGEQRLRTSTSTRDRPERGVEQEIL